MYILAALLIILLWFWWWRQRAHGPASSLSTIEPIIPARPPATPAPVVASPSAPPAPPAAAPHATVASVSVEPDAPSSEPETVDGATPVEPDAEPATAQNDKLEVIEGIGPRIATLLRTAGITTFAQLAATDVAQLKNIVRGAGLRMVHVDSWPEQARLAAAGKWEDLQDWQDQLKVGHV